METQDDEKLIQGFDKNQNLEDDLNTKSSGTLKIVLIILGVIVVLAVIAIVLYYTVFKKSSNDDSGDKSDEEDETYQTVLDTIPQEEMDNARKAFQQLQFTDTVNSSLVMDYNLFVPENYTEEKKYPLVIFIHDASIVGAKNINSTLVRSVGGPIFATEREQKKHQCFVLAPQYSEVIIDDNNGGYSKSEYINVTVRLIQKLIKDYSINTDRIYSTGQSMGAMTTLYLLANYQNLLAAGLVVDGQWKLDELQGLPNATFTYFAAGSNGKAYRGQLEVKDYLKSLNITYREIMDMNAQDNITLLNNVTKDMYSYNYSHNFIKFKDGSVLPPNAKNAHEHTSSFKYGFRIDEVRDWLFAQNKVKCEENTYYSEDGKCANTNFCKLINEDSSCQKCIYGYYLTNDKESCTKDEKCKSGDKKNGECIECIDNYYLDENEKICKEKSDEK